MERSHSGRDYRRRNPWPVAAFAFLFVMLLAYFGIYKTTVKDLQNLSPFPHVKMKYVRHPVAKDIRHFAYAVDETPGEFRLADNTGRELGVRAEIFKSASVVVKTRVEYATSRCKAEGKDQAHLKITSPHVQSNDRLIEGHDTQISFQVYSGDELALSLRNTAQDNCGNTFIRFYEENQLSHYPAIFLFLWSALCLLCIYLSVPVFVPLVGASLNCLLVLIVDTMPLNFLSELMFATLYSVAACSLWLIVLGLTRNVILRAILTFMLLLIIAFLPTIFGGHFLAFDSPPTIDTVHAILQSHKNQAIEFWTEVLGWKYSLGVFISLTVLIIGLLKTSSVRLSRSAALVLGIALLSLCLRSYPSYVNMSPMLHIFGGAVNGYFQELRAFQKLKDSRKSGLTKVEASTTQTDTTLVVVIGESVNKNHMSTYGYPRITTPTTDALVARGDMLKFNAAYANHVYSNPSISRALTEANNYNDKQWSDTPSAMTLANSAGIMTTWVSNKLKFGPWDSVMSVVGSDAQETIHINKKVGRNLVSSKFDGALVPLVEKALNKKLSLRENRVVFVHLQGSHVAYASRYPETHEKFKTGFSQSDFGAVTPSKVQDVEVVNHYDNSLYYTDSVLSDLLKILKSKKAPVAMLYVSDHGEDVFGRRSHNAALFQYNMVQIPMLFWANSSWKNSYAAKWSSIKSNLDAVFTNDLLFDMTLGLLDIKSEHTHPQNDITSEAYQEPTSPSSLHGAKRLDHEINFVYWIQKNLKVIQERWPHWQLVAPVGSVGHAQQVIANTAMHVEIKVELGASSNGQAQLLVSTSTGVKPIKLNTHLERLNSTERVRLKLNPIEPQHELQAKALLAETLAAEKNRDVSLLLSSENAKLAKELDAGIYLNDSISRRQLTKLLKLASASGINKLTISTELYEKHSSALGDGFKFSINPSTQLSISSPSLISGFSSMEWIKDARVEGVYLDVYSPYSFEQ